MEAGTNVSGLGVDGFSDLITNSSYSLDEIDILGWGCVWVTHSNMAYNDLEVGQVVIFSSGLIVRKSN